MQIKKPFKYLPIAIMTAGILLATCVIPQSSLNNPDRLKDQIFNADQEVDNADYSDQLEYIRNDVAKQDGVAYSVVSIKLAESSSGSSSAAIITKTDGSTLLYMWGMNIYGELGFTDNNHPNPIPTLVTALSGKKITQIVLGQYNSAALLGDGSLYMWGYNNLGQLGFTADRVPHPTPILVTSLSGKKITQIALNAFHSAALLDDGSLYMWGGNSAGELGFTADEAPHPTPTLVTSLSGKKITQIGLGWNFSAALLDDGSLYMWGLNNSGQLGNGTTSDTSSPTLVTALSGEKITQIEISRGNSAALVTKTDGSTLLYMWGVNQYGQLGNGISSGNAPNPNPTLVTALSGRKITQIALGEVNSAALLDDGSLYMWGYNKDGQLGNTTNNGTPNPNPNPALVTALNGKKITQIAFGAEYSAAISDNGNLYVWGRNYWGQLGFPANDIPNPIPILSSLGKDSHITANTAITARNAVDNLWIDNKFNLNGFKNSFNLLNIPETNGQEITMDTRPTYDNRAGTITMNVKIKYYYDEDGLIVADTAANPMKIGGFATGPNIITNITAKTTSVSPMVVDKWLSYVTDEEKISRTKLEEFLNLINVPADAEFTITSLNPNNKTGVLAFNISTSKTIDDLGNVENVPSYPFWITLNLTPRITKMTVISTGYPNDLSASALKAKLVDNTGLVKDISELNKYLTIVAPVDGVQYHLVDNKWDANGGDGTVDFSIYASKYYDSNGIEQAGSGSIAASKVDFTLQLQREISTIVVKATLPTNVRVDNFETYVKSAGTTVATSKLGEFFDLSNIPSDATFSVANVVLDAYDANFTRNHLTFDLTINKFNQGSPATPSTYTHNYGLTLGTQHQPTVIKAKSTYDQSIGVNKVANELKILTGVALVNYLDNYLDMQSIPNVATIAVGSITPDDATGKLTFNVIPSLIYNGTSDLVPPTADQFNVALQFGIKQAPTNITINANYAKIRIDQFANNVNVLKGQDLYNYLIPNYVSAVSVNATKLTAEVIFQDNASGKITIKLSVSQYYDIDSNLVDGILQATLDYELTPIYTPTSIKTLSASIYPRDLTPSQFKQRLKTDGAVVVGEQYTLSATNITFMKKFLIMESVPGDAIYTLTFIPQTYNVVTTPLSFNLVINKYYNANGDLINTSHAYNNLTLYLMAVDQPIKPKTEITTKPDADVVETPADFLNSITNANRTYNLEVLDKYIDGLNTLPVDANIIAIILDGVNPDGTANFTLKVSSYYNGTDINPQPDGEYKFTVKTKQVNISTSEESFPWWWIIIGIGGAAVVGLGVWLFFNKRNGGYRHRRMMRRR